MPLDSVAKKPKENPKELLLKMIQDKYGLSNAVVMEKALKTQDKQIEEAMLQGSMNADHIAESRGIDVSLLNKLIPQGSVKAQGESTQPQQDTTSQFVPAQGMFSPAQQLPSGQIQEGGALSWIGGHSTNDLLKRLLYMSKIKNGDSPESPSLVAQREATTKMLNMQITDRESGAGVEKVYRDPVTGQEVDPEQAQKDMEEGLGIYQVNQRVATRSGVQEKPLNKVPDLTQEEKKYVNDARVINNSLTNLESGFDKLYDKFGAANWQSFQMERIPYLLAQDQDVQSLKSELIYLKAGIPFLRGGKQLTPMEGKRVDVMLNPFGKTKETFKKDIQRFQNEFLVGTDITKYGINAGLMKKLIKTDKKKQEVSEPQTFKVGGKTYNIPADKVEEFKKAKGL